MSKFKCEKCANRSFRSEDMLDIHNETFHLESKKYKGDKMDIKKIFKKKEDKEKELILEQQAKRVSEHIEQSNVGTRKTLDQDGVAIHNDYKYELEINVSGENSLQCLNLISEKLEELQKLGQIDGWDLIVLDEHKENNKN
jgi:predicted lipase|tara:strand:+ start:3115 stop:3537 length:423 start_codon:yes stop_codon:yes gene_type:complete